MQARLESPPTRRAKVLRSRWLHPLNDAVAWEQMLGAINPMWSRRDYPARLLEVIDETADTRSYWLQPVRRWPGHRAGQHVVVEAQIDGRRVGFVDVQTGESVEESARMANAVAALKCRSLGARTALPRAEELAEFLQKNI